MKEINKELFGFPTIYGKWPLQSGKAKQLLNKVKPLTGHLTKYFKSSIFANNGSVKKILSVYDRKLVLETKLNEIRNICFDNSGSELWQIVNRKRFEEVFCTGSEFQQNGLPQLFNIATLFYYEHLGKSN